MHSDALLLMVKNPIPGKTKTRLAADVGDERALEIYHQLMAHTQRQARAIEHVSRYLHYSDHVDTHDDWPGRDFIKMVQIGEDLGERMALAFDRAFARHHRRVVVIGSDCPELTTEILRQAFAALETHEVVIGPTTDGGYYLLGLRNPQTTLFAGMTWSVDTVYEETMKRAAARGLSVKALPELSDVDYLEDYERLMR